MVFLRLPVHQADMCDYKNEVVPSLTPLEKRGWGKNRLLLPLAPSLGCPSARRLPPLANQITNHHPTDVECGGDEEPFGLG